MAQPKQHTRRDILAGLRNIAVAAAAPKALYAVGGATAITLGASDLVIEAVQEGGKLVNLDLSALDSFEIVRTADAKTVCVAGGRKYTLPSHTTTSTNSALREITRRANQLPPGKSIQCCLQYHDGSGYKMSFDKPGAPSASLSSKRRGRCPNPFR